MIAIGIIVFVLIAIGFIWMGHLLDNKDKTIMNQKKQIVRLNDVIKARENDLAELQAKLDEAQ